MGSGEYFLPPVLRSLGARLKEISQESKQEEKVTLAAATCARCRSIHPAASQEALTPRKQGCGWKGGLDMAVRPGARI